MLRSLIVQGMHGMGDCLHQRSVVRELSARFDVWLETSWPLVYWDMPDLKLIGRGTTLRTQLKNARRESGAFTSAAPPRGAQVLRMHYPPLEVKRRGSVLAAMSASAGVPVGDFRLPVRPEWLAKADAVLAQADRPVMFFRPLTVRKEWTGAQTRNPRPEHYAALYAAIRERFYVVSVADLVPGAEWIVGDELPADLKLHKGELDAEALFGVVARADLVFTSPGFGTVLGQALGRPGVTVFGGYEDARSFSVGAAYAPWLPIQPQHPCPCWSHTHACPKDIDVPSAIGKLTEFVDAVLGTRAEARIAA